MAIQYSDGTVVTSNQSFVPKLVIIGQMLLIVFFWIIYFYAIKSFSTKIAFYFKIESILFQKTTFFSLLFIPVIVKFSYHYTNIQWSNGLFYDIFKSLLLTFIGLW